MTDFVLGWDNEAAFGDLRIFGADLLSDEDGLATAVLVSLFTDARVAANAVPAGDPERRGWWGDQLGDDDDQIGSLLWLLDRAKLTDETVSLVEGTASNALQWIIDDGVALDVTVRAERADLDRLNLIVVTRAPDQRTREFQFADVLRGIA